MTLEAKGQEGGKRKIQLLTIGESKDGKMQGDSLKEGTVSV